ncbi:SDR family oxidoreductase [Pseudoalteromonas luteoviolacea]|uniref:SDR family oxidoreductase n=1 Tax=Pseudoalteromonas luteoviolacea TaxID=43657 RepID=UPI001F2D1AE0|nr:SDR family oxidoreductase [Pseudoalteromonas luteoviolacea]MCF6439490.1 SDR family oxidoreductase [Pseudoalteromonas luteoviolacea]
MSNILIIGAAGLNGIATIKALFAKTNLQDTIIAGVRSNEKAQALKVQFPDLETRIMNIEQPDTLAASMQDVDKVFYITGNIFEREQHAKLVIDAAVASQSVKDFVFYSVFGAEYEAILFGRQFRFGEKYLERSGLNWTHLRTIFFQDNLFGWSDGIKQGALYLGTGEGKFAPLLVSDIGEIAANVLTSNGHKNKTYNITGPELLSGMDIANAFSEALNTEITHISPDNKTTLASLLDTGWPQWQAEGLVELFNLFADNHAAVVSPDGEALLGRPLTTLKQFIEQNRAAFSS